MGGSVGAGGAGASVAWREEDGRRAGEFATLDAVLRLFLVLCLSTVLVSATELGREIAKRHEERAGGRVRDLQSLYAEGRTMIQGEVIEFKLWAARPNLLRVESTSPSRKVTQVFDGKHEPVITHSDVEGGRPLRMSPAERKDFIANADFDGPLMDHAAKGYSVDYAGTDLVADRPADKLLVMSPHDDVLFLWVDARTAEVVKRSVFRIVREQRLTMDTYFGDFREVAGTLQPHRVETKVGERTVYLMVVARMEGNSPQVTAERFAAPEGWPALAVELKAPTQP